MQQTHFESDGLFCTKHTSQLQPAGCLNKSPKPVEEERELVVVEGTLICVDFCLGASSGLGEVRAIGEAKPEENSREKKIIINRLNLE